MQYQQRGKNVVIRLDIGEEVIESIAQVCQKLKITCATVQGIGATNSFSFGFFDVHNQKYLQHDAKEDAEIVSILGNVTQKEGQLYLHLHASFGLKDGKIIGGHLNKAVVSVTAEIFLHSVDISTNRKINQVGINVISFD